MSVFHSSDDEYDPLDGKRFVNRRTGSVHDCGGACDTRIEIDDRSVCRLTRTILDDVHVARPTAPSRRPKRKNERGGCKSAARRRLGDTTMARMFPEEKDRPDLGSYVDRAMAVYDWLGKKSIPFDAVLFATLLCLAEGVRTETVHAVKDEYVASRLPPTRFVKRFGIKQNHVTRAYTEIVGSRKPLIM